MKSMARLIIQTIFFKRPDKMLNLQKKHTGVRWMKNGTAHDCGWREPSLHMDWHANPKIHPPSFVIKAKRTYIASEKWESDARKIKELEDKGFQILVIWESDYYADPDSVIKQCVEFLTIA